MDDWTLTAKLDSKDSPTLHTLILLKHFILSLNTDYYGTQTKDI